ncbi:hypothetical protein FXO37_21342 [Capsicum annuum]|nr:hypothetical protein FXO37_21342 [Capsicum annuum]
MGEKQELRIFCEFWWVLAHGSAGRLRHREKFWAKLLGRLLSQTSEMAGIVGCLRVSFGVSQWFMDGIGPREKFWMKLLGRFPNGLLNRLGCFGRAGESFSKSNGRNDWNCRFFCEVLVDLCPRFKDNISRYLSTIEEGIVGKEMEKLTKLRDEIKAKVEGAEEEGYKPKPDVVKWIEIVHKLAKEWESMQEIIAAAKTLSYKCI